MRLALAAVAALAVAASACGGVENDPNLAKAAERTEATGSFALEAKSRFTDGGEEFEMSCDGVVDSTRQRSHLLCSDAESVSETITVDGTTYLKAEGTDGKWRKSPTEDYEAPEQFTPERILGLLRTASRKTERVGDEDVRGERTVRYALTVDCEQAELVDCEGQTGVVDVWIDGDGLVRRIAFDEESVAWSIEFFDFGVPVDVEAPPADQVAKWPPPDLIAPCTPEKAGPIGVEQAIEALRKQGFDMRRDHFGCGAGVAETLTNAPGDEWADLLRRDGHLSCFVFTSEQAGTTGIGVLLPEVSSGEPLPRPVQRELENVDCTLYVEGPNAKERIASLDTALADLKRELGG